MTKKKGLMSVGALFMGLIVVLGMIGIVNGLWSKNLVVNGTVQTGDLNADWNCGYTNDDGHIGATGLAGHHCGTTTEPAGDTGLDPIGHNWPSFTRSNPFTQKDVGECHLTIGDKIAPPNGFGDQVAYVTITNAYPSYECTTTLNLSNTGSIPFNVISAQLIQPAGQTALETIDASGVDQCNPASLATKQVDPGKDLAFTCTVHVKETAAQSTCTGATTSTASGGPTVENETCNPATTYPFAVDVCVAQWNEAATAAQCKSSPQHEGPPATTFGG